MIDATGTAAARADALRTPVPWARVLTVGAVLLANHFSMLVVLPVVPFMVASFFPASPKSQLGYYTGYLTTAFFLGQLLAAYGWGWAADHWGRRPTLMAGLVGTAVTILLFGLSSSYSDALLMRFLWGLSNGNISVSKAYLSDILDPTNSARGFTIFGLQAAVGRFFGPPVGGWLSNPQETLPEVTRVVPLLAAHPYLLPCAVASLLSIVCLALAYFRLPESLRRGHRAGEAAVFPPRTEQLSPLLPAGRRAGDVDCERAEQCGFAKAAIPPVPAVAMDSVLCPALLVSSALYCALGVCHVGYEEMFSLWVILDHSAGGFGFSAAQLGTTMAATGPVLIVSQLVLVPRLTERLCCRQAFQLAMCCLALSAFAMPLWSLAGRAHSPPVEAAAATVAFMLLSMSTEAACTFVFVLINESVPYHVRGRANGVAAVLAAVGRTAGTSFWGPLFSWNNSLAPDPGLLHPTLPFVAIGSLAVLAAAMTPQADPRAPAWPGILPEQSARVQRCGGKGKRSDPHR